MHDQFSFTDCLIGFDTASILKPLPANIATAILVWHVSWIIANGFACSRFGALRAHFKAVPEY